MADVDVFDENGKYQGIFTKQIALQHGYGDGKEESCERQVKAVSRMFHNIPINSYAAISMDSIPELNDELGGITVEVLDDIVYPEYDMNLHAGETVTLYGEQAYWYWDTGQTWTRYCRQQMYLHSRPLEKGLGLQQWRH